MTVQMLIIILLLYLLGGIFIFTQYDNECLWLGVIACVTASILIVNSVIDINVNIKCNILNIIDVIGKILEYKLF